jgi:hypothetical protein
MPASFPTLLLEKTTAGLRERERPHEGVLPKPSAPALVPVEQLGSPPAAHRGQRRRGPAERPAPLSGDDMLEPAPTRDQVHRRRARDAPADLERGGRNAGAIIVGRMGSEAVEPPGAAAQRVVGSTRARAAQLASVLSRTADTLEQSAALADAHAERYEQAGRSDDAAQERRAAGRARETARNARSHAEEWAELAAGGKP